MGKKVVIVGAGPGGLASAVLLGGAGFDVTLVERRADVGGRTSSVTEGGYRWDRGPTFFLYPQILSDILARVGVRLEDRIDLRRLDPQYRLIFGAGGQLDATPSIAGMEAQIAALAPDDVPGFRRFLDANRGKFEAFRPILERPFLSLRDYLRPDILKALPRMNPFRSLARDLERFFGDERLRLAFSFQSKYLGMSPFRCPSLFSILSFLEYEYGVFHPIGGCHAVMEALAQVAQEVGVKILLEEPVTDLTFRGRRVVGVQTPQRHLPADAVVVNADFARFMNRIVPGRLRRKWTDARIAKSRFSCSTFMLYLGLDGPCDLAHHTIYITKDYERNLREIEKDHVLSEDPSFYVQNPCVTDPTLAPPGKSALYVLIPVTHAHDNVDWTKEAPAFRERTLDRLSAIGLTDVRRRIVVEKMITPAEWDEDMQIHRGATFNLSHDLSQMLWMRPRNRFEDVDGMYLVGGGTHPGSGLPVIFESAKITATLLERDLGTGGTRTPLAHGSASS